MCKGAIDAIQERKMLETVPMGSRPKEGTAFINRNDVYGESSVNAE